MLLSWKQTCRSMEQSRKPIYYKGTKNIQWEKNKLFNKQCWGNWTIIWNRMELDHYLKLYTNITHSKGISLECKTWNHKAVLLLEISKRVNLKIPHPKKKIWNYVWGQMLARIIVVIISPYVYILSPYVV